MGSHLLPNEACVREERTRLGQVKGLWLRTVKAGRWPGGRAEPDQSGLYSSTPPFVLQIG